MLLSELDDHAIKILEGFSIPIAGPLHKLIQEPLPYTIALLSFYLCPFHHRGTSQIDVQGQRPQETIDDALATYTLGDCDGQCSALGVMRKPLPSLLIADRTRGWCHTSVFKRTAR